MTSAIFSPGTGNRHWATLCVLLGVVAAPACSLEAVKTPELSGPSTLALSLNVAAAPDLLSRDGAQQSTVTVTARDASAQPIRHLAVRVDIKVNGQFGDLGTLSSRTLSTNAEGKAIVVYTAPPAAPFGAPNDATIQIVATPVGADAANTTSSAASIHLTAAGVIQAPNSACVPRFFVSPSSPHERETVTFDGSASSDADGRIQVWFWNFGDGTTAASGSATVSHLYGVAAAYAVTLTCTDDRGLSATSAPSTLTVVAAANPVATFVASPTNARVGDTVSFNASASSVPPGRQIQSWRWDFGDGTPIVTTTEPTTAHIFALAKTYTVVLTVSDDIGRTATVTLTVTVNP